MWVRHPSHYSEEVIAQMKEATSGGPFKDEQVHIHCVFEAESALPRIVLAAEWGRNLFCEPVTFTQDGIMRHVIWGYRDEGFDPWGEVFLLQRDRPGFNLPPWCDRRIQLGAHSSDQRVAEELSLLMSSIDFPGLNPPHIQPISGNGAYLFWKAK